MTVPSLADVVLAFAITAFAQLELAFLDVAGPQSRALQVGFALATTLPIVVRRRWPVPVLVFTAVAFGAKGVILEPVPEVLGEALAYLVAIYTVAALCNWRVAVLGWVTASGLGELRLLSGNAVSVSENVINIGFNTAMLVLGRTVHSLESRAARSEQHSQVVEAWARESSREAVAHEQARIARELHDIVAHDIGVVLLHARGGRKLLGPEASEARGAFDSIESAGADALHEMRRLLAVLRTDDEPLVPQPTLADLPALAERIRAVGVQVALNLAEGLPHVSPGLGLCVYRIAQEAVTNALRHGLADFVSIDLRTESGGLRLEILDDGTLQPEPSAEVGYGIAGMRERVALFGGTLTLGPRSDGGFGVRAWFPMEAT